ncbi:MAG: ribonuclease Z [Saprospiraceae bacterium]|nr:ribonuclease Z [Saprospiraceae bacterium]
MRFGITILGVNAAIPSNRRHLTAQVVNVQEELFLVDCGEGTQIQLRKFGIKKHKINHIFISHLHGDHFFGLAGLLLTFALDKRTTPLHIYSPEGLEKLILLQLEVSHSQLNYPLIFHVTDPTRHELIYKSNTTTVYTIPLKHRIPTNGYLFREAPHQRRILKSAIDQYTIPNHQLKLIKKGEDFIDQHGKSIPNNLLTLSPPFQRSYAFCSDTEYHEPILPIIQGVDLLYHESTFLHELKGQAKKTQHSTALEAGTIAQTAKVGQLLLGHFSSRYKDLNPLLEEAQSVFESTELATEGKTYWIELRKSS